MVAGKEGARVALVGAPRPPTKDAKVPATVKASKMWGSMEGAERARERERVEG